MNQFVTESLEEELQLYKRLIATLPYEINYFDELLNKRITKEKDKQTITIRPDKLKEKQDKNAFVFPKPYNQFLELEEFLEPLFDLIPHHIVIIDKHGVITLCNKQTLDDFQTTKDAVVGKHIKHLLNIDESQIRTLETLRTGQELFNEEVLDTNYGICNTRIIYDESGNILRVISLFHFLNPLKEAEKMNMMGQISASIAHEVRNPLTTVRGYLQLMSQGELPVESEVLKELLIPELDRANKIISDFLMVSKNSPVKKSPEKITDFLLHFKNLMYSEAVMKEVSFSVHSSADLTETVVLLNHNELLQVFVNLFNNSVDSKFPGRPLVITVDAKTEDDTIHITFKDNGTGMNPANLRYIFDPFFSTKDTGTGLGLSLSKKIVELHHGTITVSSTPTIGTTFLLTIPIHT